MSAKTSVKQVVMALRVIAKLHGYEVRYYTYSALKSSTNNRGFTSQFPLGEFDARKKRIIIRKYRNTFKHSVMCVLAHEISHVLHVANGKYPKYYSEYWAFQVLSFFRGNNINYNKLDVSCFKQGVAAERDCDEWAKEYLGKHGYKYSPKMLRLYPESMVMGYDLYRAYLKEYQYRFDKDV